MNSATESGGRPIIIQYGSPGKVKRLKQLKLIRELKDLPELLYVETRFVTKRFAELSNLKATSLIPEPTPAPPSVIIPPFVLPSAAPSFIPLEVGKTPPNMPNIQWVPFNKTYASIAVQTDPNPISHEIGLQTEKTERCDMAVQCKMPRSNFMVRSQRSDANKRAMSPEGEVELFNLAETSSHAYSNGRHECLLCGEIALGLLELQTHMATHCAQPILCSSCGRYHLENEPHRCNKNVPRKRRTPYHCPHSKCSVIAVSKLELYDHINEHMRQRVHRCKACRRVFTTVGQLRHHSKRSDCLFELMNHQLVYSLKSRLDRVYRQRILLRTTKKKRVLLKRPLPRGGSLHCRVCLKKFPNSFQHKNHFRRCSRTLQQRWQKKFASWKPQL